MTASRAVPMGIGVLPAPRYARGRASETPARFGLAVGCTASRPQFAIEFAALVNSISAAADDAGAARRSTSSTWTRYSTTSASAGPARRAARQPATLHLLTALAAAGAAVHCLPE